MAKLNQTGSQVRETQLPSFIVVNTPYSHTEEDNQEISRRRNQKHHHHQHTMVQNKTTVQQREAARRIFAGDGAILRRGGTRNQNNASVENRDATDEEPMEVDRSDADRSPVTPAFLASNAVRHSQSCSTNFNKKAPCNCEAGDKAKIAADIRTDIVPPRRRRGKRNTAQNFNEEDCGESPWSWHVDAKWGCHKYPEVYYCDEDCPSLLEYLLCPEDENCDDTDEWWESTLNAAEDAEPDLDAVIKLRQGESGDYEVRNLNVAKKDFDDFTVSWKHPPGDHPTYVVVVYPPTDSPAAKPSCGPDSGHCAEEEECLCSSQPIFRMHVNGGQTSCDFPVECLEPGKTFIVEVATLSEARDKSFGTSLVLVDVFALNK